jgi:hypothetical protein
MTADDRAAITRRVLGEWARRYAGLIVVVALLIIVVLVAPTAVP